MAGFAGGKGSLRPFFPYYGSKFNLARHYPAPCHGLVVEPFAGSAGYATFHGCRDVLLVDRDPIIVGVWRYLMSVTADEVMALPELPDAGDSVDDHDLCDGARWLVGFWLNRGSSQPKRTRTAYSARADRNQLNWGPDAKRRIASQLPALRGWQVELGGYDTAPDVEATWFVDPPYGDKGKFYRCRFDDFDSLGPWCLERRGRVMVCEGPGATWLPFSPFGSFKSTRGRADEVAYVAEHGPEGRRMLDGYGTVPVQPDLFAPVGMSP